MGLSVPLMWQLPAACRRQRRKQPTSLHTAVHAFHLLFIQYPASSGMHSCASCFLLLGPLPHAAPRTEPTPAPRACPLQVPDVEQFMATYNMQCPMAAKRLIHSGMPATIEHNVRPRMDSTASTAIAVAESVQHFITAMDSLKLNMVAVDQIYPLLSDLVQSMMKVRGGRVGGRAAGRASLGLLVSRSGSQEVVWQHCDRCASALAGLVAGVWLSVQPVDQSPISPHA